MRQCEVGGTLDRSIELVGDVGRIDTAMGTRSHRNPSQPSGDYTPCRCKQRGGWFVELNVTSHHTLLS